MPPPLATLPSIDAGQEDDLDDDADSVASDDSLDSIDSLDSDGISSVSSVDAEELAARAEFLAEDLPSETCLLATNLVTAKLHNTEREDIVFIAFQFWTLSMSLAALANESIPYIIASFLTHAINTAWGAFQIYHTNEFRHSYELIVENGACSGFPSILGPYWGVRRSFEMSSLVLHAVALAASAWLTWKLVKLFGWNTFQRLGASRAKDRMFKLSLSLSLTIHLGLFFLVVMAALWVDELYNGIVRDSSFPRGVAGIPLVLLVLWASMGFYAIANKRRPFLMGFIGLSVTYILTAVLFFVSPIYRWTFQQWRFYSIVVVASILLLSLGLGLSIACLVFWKEEEAGVVNPDRKSMPNSVFPTRRALNISEKKEIGSFDYDWHSSEYPSSTSDEESVDIYATRQVVNRPPTVSTFNTRSESPTFSVDYGALHVQYPFPSDSPLSKDFPSRVPTPTRPTGGTMDPVIPAPERTAPVGMVRPASAIPVHVELPGRRLPSDLPSTARDSRLPFGLPSNPRDSRRLDSRFSVSSRSSTGSSISSASTHSASSASSLLGRGRVLTPAASAARKSAATQWSFVSPGGGYSGGTDVPFDVVMPKSVGDARK